MVGGWVWKFKPETGNRKLETAVEVVGGWK